MEKLTLKHLQAYPLKDLKVMLSDIGVLNLDEEYPSGNSQLEFNITNILIGEKIEIEIHNHKVDWGVGFIELEEIKPILRPLSDLFKNVEGLSSGVEISHIERMLVLLNRSVYGDESLRGIWNNIVNNVTLMTICENKIIIDYLYSNHFDVEAIFNHGKGLIEKGLAIDINTIKEVTDV